MLYISYRFPVRLLKRDYSDESKVWSSKELTRYQRNALLGVHKRYKSVVAVPSELDIEFLIRLCTGLLQYVSV